MREPVVRLRSLTKRYGPVAAVDDVDVDLYAGEVHVVAGENGAGKSTLMKLLAQVEQPSSGEIVLDGDTVSYAGPRTAQRLGIAMVHQELALAPDLSVMENLFLGREPARGGLISRSRMQTLAVELLRRVGLTVEPDRLVRRLSVAQQQLVEIAKALSIDARIVIMDEPTATLNDHEVDDLAAVIDRLRADGIAVLYISHRLEEIFRLADRVTVMRDGAVVATRKTDELDERELVRLMVGRTVDELYPTVATDPGDVVLRASGLRNGNRLGPCELEVREGEILGLAGLVGSGRTELVRSLYGAYPLEEGAIEVDGVRRRIRRPSDGLMAGIGYLSEDRKGDGLAVDLGIASNITLASLPSAFGLLRRGDERRRAEQRRGDLGIRTGSVFAPVRTLSGGNQQKVSVAKILETNARVLLFDEPARGIDVGAKAEMFGLIAALAREQRAVVMVSSYLPELLAMCHRIAVMHEGRIAGVLQRSEFSEEAVMALATGVDGKGAA